MSQPDLESIKKTIKALTDKKAELEDKKRELKFEISKAEEQLQELEPKILELFGTTDIDKLEKTLADLSKEAESILSEIDELEEL